MGLKNSSDSQGANVSVIVYDQSGNVVMTEDNTIPARGQDAWMVGAGLENEGWVRVSSNQPLTGLCFILFRNRLMAFWSSDDKVIQAGMSIFICAAIFQVFDAVTIIYNGSLRGAGDTVWLAVISSIGAVVILGLGGLVTVGFFPQLGPLGPWIAATANITAVALAEDAIGCGGGGGDVELTQGRGDADADPAGTADPHSLIGWQRATGVQSDVPCGTVRPNVHPSRDPVGEEADPAAEVIEREGKRA